MTNNTTEQTVNTVTTTTAAARAKRTYNKRSLSERLASFTNQELEAFIQERTADVTAACEVVKQRTAEQAKLEKLAAQNMKTVAATTSSVAA